MNAQHASRPMKHFHRLYPDQHEALALMMEECGEVNCTIGTLMLDGTKSPAARTGLVRETGDFLAAIEMCARAGLISQTALRLSRDLSLEQLGNRMQHITLETPEDEPLDDLAVADMLEPQPAPAPSTEPSRFHRLSPDEYVALNQMTVAIGRVLHMIGKIMRHGLLSVNPEKRDRETNLDLLQYAIGEALAAIEVLGRTGLLTVQALTDRRREKLARIGRYLHHIVMKGEGAHALGEEDLSTDWIFGIAETQRLRAASAPVAAGA